MKTAAELKAEQEAREQANREAKAKQEEERDQRQKDALEATLKSQVDALKRTWGEQVEDAAKRDGVRFLVLAQATWPFPPVVQELIKEIESKDYKAEPANLHQAMGDAPARTKPEARELTFQSKKGWLPAQIPTLRSSGGMEMKHLIIKWW